MNRAKAFTYAIRAARLDLTLGITWLMYLGFIFIVASYSGPFDAASIALWGWHLIWLIVVLSQLWIPGAITWYAIKKR